MFQFQGYSGVAIFSKVPPDSVVAGFHSKVDAPADREGRVLTARFKGMFTVVAAYVPNSGLKLDRLGYRTNGAKACRYVDTIKTRDFFLAAGPRARGPLSLADIAALLVC